MNVSYGDLQVPKPKATKLGATPKLDIHEWPVLIKMLQARIRLEKEAPPGEFTRLITEAWNILLKELPSGNKETRRRLKKHAGNPHFIVKDDGKFDDFPHGPQIYLISQSPDGTEQSEKLFVPSWHVDKVLNANHPYNTTYIQGRQMHTGGEALFALISEQYYGVSRKKCQQWVNDCPICRSSRIQGIPQTTYYGEYDSEEMMMKSELAMPFINQDNGMLSPPIKKSRKYPFGAESVVPAPKRIKADSKTQFVMNVDKAEKRMRPYTIETPFFRSDFHSLRVNANVYLKCENFQVSGSYKARGTYNKVLLEKERIKKGAIPTFITSSTGNLTDAFIHSIISLEMNGEIIVPNNIDQFKLEKLKSLIIQLGGQQNILIRVLGESDFDADLIARNESVTRNLIYISSYNDLEVLYGFTSIAPEMLRQMRKNDNRKIDYIIIPAVKGSLVAGIASYFKEIAPFTKDDAKIIGVSSINECPLINALSENKDDMARMENDSIPLHLSQKYVDEWVTVSEEEIEEVICEEIQKNFLIERYAAMSIAALYKEKQKYEGKTVVSIITGANLGIHNLSRILNKFQK